MFKKVWLVLFVAVAVAVASVGCSNQSSLSEQEYIEQAKDFIDHGDYRAAVIQLKNAIRTNPDSMTGRYLLGEVYVRGGNGGSAEKELRKAAELGVEPEAIILKLGDALLLQGEADKLINEFKLLDSDSKQVRSYKSVVIGDAYFQKRDYAEAAVAFQRALGAVQDNTRAKLGLARVALTKRDYGQAARLIDEVVSQTPNEILAWLTKADLHRAQQDGQAAIQAFSKAATLAKSKQDYFYFVAMRSVVLEQLNISNTEQAEVALNELQKAFYKEQFPDVIELNQIRSVLAYQQKHYEQAAELANKVLKQNDKHLGSILLVGAINTVGGRYEQAEKHLTRFLSFVPGHIQARKLLAFVQVNRSRAQEAVETLSPIIEHVAQPDAETLALIARASLQVGDAVKSEGYYALALQENPDESGLMMGLAQSYVAQGEFDKAIVELEKIAKDDDKKHGAELAIAETHIKAKNFVAALETLVAIEKTNADDPLPVSLQGTVYQLMGDEAKAKNEFKRALLLSPAYAPAARSLALMALKVGKKDEAEQYYKDLLAVDSANYATMYDYAQLAMQNDVFEKAAELLKKAKGLDQDKTRSAVLLARLYIRQQKPSLALSELRPLADVNNSAVFAEQGNAQMMMAEYLNAANSYNRVVALESSSATAHYLVYTAYRAANDKANAEKALAASLALDNKYVPSLVAAVEMALSSRDIVGAKQRLSQLKTATPTNDAVLLFSAEIAMRENQPELAVSIYENFYNKTSSTVVLHKLSQAYWSMGKQELSISLLKDAAVKKPQDVEVQYLLASAYEALGEMASAIDTYEVVIKLNDRHVIALNNLAWLIRNDNPKQAREYAQRASELAPDNQAVKDTLMEIEQLGR